MCDICSYDKYSLMQSFYEQVYEITPMGKPPPLAVRLAKALPFRRAQIEMRDALTAHDDLHTADGAHACAHVGVDADHMARQGQRYGTYAMAAGMLQSLQALSPRQWPPLGAFIKLPALRVVHDFGNGPGSTQTLKSGAYCSSPKLPVCIPSPV